MIRVSCYLPLRGLFPSGVAARIARKQTGVVTSLDKLTGDQLELRWRFFLAQRPMQFCQGDILELTDSLP
ncbi:MAG TPA: hypothetical protein VGH55_08580, partial [Chthoniobacterales bacterium]